MSSLDQACVVPYRFTAAGPSFCLITSHGGDWIFPKGNIDPGFTPEAAGLQEAREEAGLEGRIVGTLTEFMAHKGHYSLRSVAFLMEVTDVAERWDEDSFRERRWSTAEEVRLLVERPELREVFRTAVAHLAGEALRGDEEPTAAADLAEGASAVLILEDDPDRVDAMLAELAAHAADHLPVVFDNAPDTIAWLERNLTQCALISLDHDLGPSRDRAGERFDPGSGRDVVDWLETREPVCPVIVHTSNTFAAPGMAFTLQFARWLPYRVAPFNDLEWVGSAWVEALGMALRGEPPPTDS